MKEKLNYECRLFNGSILFKEFDFHAENKELAEDHAIHCVRAEGCSLVHWRNKNNTNWKLYINEPNRI